MDAACTIQDSIHVFSLVHKYVSRILGTYHFPKAFCLSSYLDICSSCLMIIFLTISPPIEPACLDVRSPLYPSFKGTPISDATSCLKRFIASFACGTAIWFVPELELLDPLMVFPSILSSVFPEHLPV